MLTGCTISAEEAVRIGLVDEVVAPDALLEAATDMARQMGENPQAALKMVKTLVTENFSEGDTDLVQKREMEALATCYASAEHKEAIAAFMEKRPPDFKRARQDA